MGARVAALYDIHANLPALEAVLDELRQVGVDQLVVGGDVVPGPMPCETLELLLALEMPVQYLYGNGERAVLAQTGVDSEAVEYWGTVSGDPPPESVRQVLRWTAGELSPQHHALLRGWPATRRVAIDGLGDVLFCHGTPRSETECFTRLTPEHALAPLFEGLGITRVVCGHTHMPFDRTIAGVRVINAGSVGMPFGAPGADWLLLGPEIEFRHTSYDLERAARRVRDSRYPQAEEFAARSILQPPPEAQMLDALTTVSFR